jgi:hypothetical protein
MKQDKSDRPKISSPKAVPATDEDQRQLHIRNSDTRQNAAGDQLIEQTRTNQDEEDQAIPVLDALRQQQGAVEVVFCDDQQEQTLLLLFAAVYAATRVCSYNDAEANMRALLLLSIFKYRMPKMMPMTAAHTATRQHPVWK